MTNINARVSIFFTTYLILFGGFLYLFNEYIFPLSLDFSQKFAFSILTSLPSALLASIILLIYLPCTLLYIFINFLIVPAIDIQKKIKKFLMTKEEKIKRQNDKKNKELIYRLKMLVCDKITGDLIKQLYFKDLFAKSINYSFMEPDKIEFKCYINMIVSKEELCRIVNNAPINLLLQTTKNSITKENKDIDLFKQWKDHNLIIKTINNMKRQCIDQEEPIKKTHWLEKFEDYLINTKIYFFKYSSFVQKIKNRREEEINNKYREYIRCDEIMKKIRFLCEKRAIELDELYKNDELYYL